MTDHAELLREDILEVLKSLALNPTTPAGRTDVVETQRMVRDLATSVQQIANTQMSLQSQVSEVIKSQQEVMKGQQDLIGRLIKMETREEMKSSQSQNNADRDWKWAGIIIAICLALFNLLKDYITTVHK